jgi:hypothetical protein
MLAGKRIAGGMHRSVGKTAANGGERQVTIHTAKTKTDEYLDERGYKLPARKSIPNTEEVAEKPPDGSRPSSNGCASVKLTFWSHL